MRTAYPDTMQATNRGPATRKRPGPWPNLLGGSTCNRLSQSHSRWRETFFSSDACGRSSSIGALAIAASSVDAIAKHFVARAYRGGSMLTISIMTAPITDSRMGAVSVRRATRDITLASAKTGPALQDALARGTSVTSSIEDGRPVLAPQTAASVGDINLRLDHSKAGRVSVPRAVHARGTKPSSMASAAQNKRVRSVENQHCELLPDSVLLARIGNGRAPIESILVSTGRGL